MTSVETDSPHPQSKPKSRQRRIQIILLQILGLLLLAIPFAGLLVLNELADKIIFFKYGRERWAMQRPGTCSMARKELVYADMRPGHPDHKRAKPLEFSCEQAQNLPAESFYAQTIDGLKIHYRLFKPESTAEKPDLPVLLHVPGITSTWLDGARYAGVAKRLGFRLAVLELRNHGISDNNQQGAAYGCKEREDVLAVVRDLHQRYPKSQMMLWSSSMGSMSVLNAVPELKEMPQVKALLLENFPTSLREVVEVSFSPGHPALLYDSVLLLGGIRLGVNFKACSPVEQAKDLTIPAFVSVTLADDLTPVWMVEKAFKAFPANQGHRFKLYSHGRHAAVWNGQPEQYEKDIRQFWLQAQKK